MLRARPSLWGALVAALLLPACGAGVIGAEDVTGGEAAVIGVVIVAAVLFAVYVGMRDR